MVAWCLVLLLLMAGAASAQTIGTSSRPRIGLALGGGSARGLAHIGLLEWFEEHHIPIDVIAGTSMGGLVGGAYAAGLSPAEIRALLANADWGVIFRGEAPFRDKSFRRKQDERAAPTGLEFGLRGGLHLPSGLNSGQQVDLLLDAITVQYPDLESFDELPTPFRCVAADLVSAAPAVLGHGSLASAMRATMSLPGVFAPVRVGDQVLVDGGIFDNVPAGVARAMGADVVIAVSVGASDAAGSAGAPVDYSVLSVLGRMVDAMMAGNTRRGAAAADLVIRPAVDQVASMDFADTIPIARLGYEAAAAHAAALHPYALDPEAYAAFRAVREARRRTAQLIPEAIEATGSSPEDRRAVERRLGHHIGRPLDVAALAADITRLSGSDRYQTIRYRVTPPPARTLVVDLFPRPNGPPFLAIVPALRNTSATTLEMAVGGRVTAYDIAGYGSELRLNGWLGFGAGADAELYRPLARSRWFVAPRASVQQNDIDLFDDSEPVATYRYTRAGVGFDVGYSIGARSEMRALWDAGVADASVRVGDPVLPELDGGEQAVGLAWVFDGQDSPTVPSRGVYVRARLDRFLQSAVPEPVETTQPALPYAEAFTRADVSGSWFVGLTQRTRIFTLLQGGTTFGDRPPPPHDFALGGPFRLGAYRDGELRTGDYAIGAGGVAREVGRLPAMLGGGAYISAWLESGSAFDGEAMRSNVSGAFILETLLGPISLGASAGLDGRHRVYVAVGPVFRGQAAR